MLFADKGFLSAKAFKASKNPAGLFFK